MVELGESVQGRTIRAVRVGERDAERKALVVGSIHGDEPAGIDVTRRLRQFRNLRNVDIWVIDAVNPDGLAARRRQNARGVDLNRNFPHRWRPSSPGSRYYGGRRPVNQPESRIIRRLVKRIRPSVSIWYHQPWGHVILPNRGPAKIHRRYARLARFPARKLQGSLARLPGTVIGWQNKRFPGTTAFVVELGASQPSPRKQARHARAAARVAAGR